MEDHSVISSIEDHNVISSIEDHSVISSIEDHSAIPSIVQGEGGALGPGGDGLGPGGGRGGEGGVRLRPRLGDELCTPRALPKKFSARPSRRLKVASQEGQSARSVFGAQ